MSDIIETNKNEIKENSRSVSAFKEELDNVKKTSEIGKEQEETQNVLEKLQEVSLINVLDKYIKKDGNEINYRDDYANKTKAGETVTSGETGVITTATQIALKHLGINPGNIDGLYGPKTIAAVNLFKEKALVKNENGIGPNTIKKIIEELKKKTINPNEEEINTLPANQNITTESNIEKVGETISKAELLKIIKKSKTFDEANKALEKYNLIYNVNPEKGYEYTDTADNSDNYAVKKSGETDNKAKVTEETALKEPEKHHLISEFSASPGFKIIENTKEHLTIAPLPKNKIINNIEEISKQVTWPENTVKILMIKGKQYGFFNNGRVGILNSETGKYENMQDTQNLVNKLQEKLTNKKANLIKQLELKSLENGLYEKKDMKGLYKITNEGKLLYFGPDAGSKIFVGPKSDNRKSISEKEIPIDLKKNTIIKSVGLKEESKNKYSKEGLTGFYAFGNDNKLYYSGTDIGNKVFLGYTDQGGNIINETDRRTGENKQRKDINTIPEEIDYISV